MQRKLLNLLSELEHKSNKEAILKKQILTALDDLAQKISDLKSKEDMFCMMWNFREVVEKYKECLTTTEYEKYKSIYINLFRKSLDI